MSVFHFIIQEILHRKANAAMTLFAVTAAVGLFVFFQTTSEASQRETKRNLRDMGQNLRIIAKETDMEQFWDRDFSSVLMPEEWVLRFETVEGLYYSHLTASLRRRIEWNGRPAILSGISAEISPPGRKKPSMVFKITPGTVYVGHELARSRDLKKGDAIELMGQSFTVAAVLAESGTDDDIRLTTTLKDAQALLKLEGQINEIQALDCYCQHPDKDTLTVLREQLAEVLPEAKVIKMQQIAMARENQRTMMEGYFAWVAPSLILVCGVLIGALSFLNIRERRQEMGVIRALGFGGWHIAGLFLGKAVLLGGLAAGIGFTMGTWMSLSIGPELFKLTAKNLAPVYSLLGWSLLGAPAFAVAFSFLPAMLAVSEDPAETLRHD